MFLHEEKTFISVYKHHQSVVDIPTGDGYAYELYPNHRWMYNKLALYESLGYNARPFGLPPKYMPVFIKPIYNLFGMGIGAEIMTSYTEDMYKAGYLWMPIFTGKHISTDYALLNGKIVWSYSVLGHKDTNNSFTYWSHTVCKQTHEKKWIENHLSDFTGIVNVESIGNKIIEVHLRMSNQFIDLYGDDFVTAAVKLYDNKVWTKSIKNKKGYSYVVRVLKTAITKNIVIKRSIRSTNKEKIYYTTEENKKLGQYVDNDVCSYRIAVINGTNKRKCKNLAENIKKDIKMQINTY